MVNRNIKRSDEQNVMARIFTQPRFSAAGISSDQTPFLSASATFPGLRVELRKALHQKRVVRLRTRDEAEVRSGQDLLAEKVR